LPDKLTESQMEPEQVWWEVKGLSRDAHRNNTYNGQWPYLIGVPLTLVFRRGRLWKIRRRFQILRGAHHNTLNSCRIVRRLCLST
jgi:hypothetical protein